MSAYGDELTQLADDLARMGGLVETQVTDALAAVVRRDMSVTADVRTREDQVNALQAEIEKRVIRLFALRQPLATDLRQTISALKIASDLERMGDLAKNIAYRATDLKDAEPVAVLHLVDRLGAIVRKQLSEVLDAMSAMDIEPAIRVWRSDDEVDEHYNSLIQEMLGGMSADGNLVGPGAHILFVAKNLERIGDHATNIAEAVHYMVTGIVLESVDQLDQSDA
ncbi:phosphate signaling complex protein PhoU [Maricaulis sp. D1M11]|uniref:phosphate signaling complex protein PhoU n=1 Tax=Maricaulis sp. D1M11 TaxID=3076117 RepID=UPI0039B3C53D